MNWLWDFTLLKGREIAVESTLDFEDVDFRVGGFSFEGVQGQLLLEEEVMLSPKTGLFSFRYLIHQDPFLRVWTMKECSLIF